MKILNINSYYYSSSVHRQLKSSLADQEIEVETYVPLARGYVPRAECTYKEDTGITAVECYNSFDRVIFSIKHNKIEKDIIGRFDFGKYDCMHAHSLFSNGYIAYRINKRYGLPYVVAVRGTDLNTFFKRMIHLRKLGVEILKNASKIIFISSAYKHICIKKYCPNPYRTILEQKSLVIPNGIDDFWHRNRYLEARSMDSTNIKLIFVGQIMKRKNLMTVKQACDILIERGYNVAFKIVGSVVDKSELNKVKRVQYIEHIDRVGKEQLLEIYRSSDVFVMPSISETFGLVYPEAMSQGLPVIYTKDQGFDGQFEEGKVGYHVNCFNPEEIADRIIDIINNYKSISMNCIESISCFDWEKISLDYMKVYEEIARNR